MRPSLRFTAPLIAALMLSSSLLSACSTEAEPEPKFDSPTSSASPNAAEAEPPPKRETVKQFLVRWAEAERDMQNTGETEAYLAMSPGCEPCEALAETVVKTYASNGFIRTGAMEIERVQRVDKSDLYRVWGTLPETTYQNSESEPEASYDGGPRLYQFQISRSADVLGVAGLVAMPR